MPLLLLIETSTDICSVCLSNGETILDARSAVEQYTHAKAITLLIEACMKAGNRSLTDLDAVAISSGPGSYTALRVGTSTAKGICYALNKPLIAISTLQMLADAAIQQAADQQGLYCPMIDARRMEVYTAVYDSELKEVEPTQALILDEQSFQQQFETGNKCYFVGDGSAKFEAILTNPLAVFPKITNSATLLNRLALKAYEQKQFSDLAYFSPNYFKSPNITKSKKVL